MKKMIIIILISSIFYSTQNSALTFDNNKDIKELIQRKYDIPIAIMQCETAYFDEKVINRSENAVGVLQIRPVMVKEVNRIIEENPD